MQINDWFGAAKKTLLSNANKLLQDMQEFDKDNIPDKVIAVRRKDTKHTHNDDCSREIYERYTTMRPKNVAVVRADSHLSRGNGANSDSSRPF